MISNTYGGDGLCGVQFMSRLCVENVGYPPIKIARSYPLGRDRGAALRAPTR
jgi:hypothetical protein